MRANKLSKASFSEFSQSGKRDTSAITEDCIKLFERQHTWAHSAASYRIICVSRCSTDETIILKQFPVKHRTNAAWLVAFVSMVTKILRKLHRSNPRLFGQIYIWSRDCQCSYQRHEPTRHHLKILGKSFPTRINHFAEGIMNGSVFVTDSNLYIDDKKESLEIDATSGDSSEVPKLSKRQLKKLKKKEKWLERLPAKRAKERERLKQRKLEARLNKQPIGTSRKLLKNSKMSERHQQVRESSYYAVIVPTDELRIQYSCTSRVLLEIQRLKWQNILVIQTGMYVNFKSESYMDIFDKNELIYLSSDSDNIITTLDDNKVYIIGGLVDHNSQKGLTLQIANDKGIAHAQLPIREYLEMRTTKVLSIVHVFEILLAVTEGSPWKEALLNVLPSRKGATEKYESSASDSETEGAENMFEVEGTIETATHSNKCIEAADRIGKKI
uniref:tRNA (guanine(9)-N(1))-methyltransferase n=1 Tax=Timema cristinae TaxID=61476 RepID=A0A7R9GQ44_TIMCR|nr:unnamed protein product [Timema cristinae]